MGADPLYDSFNPGLDEILTDHLNCHRLSSSSVCRRLQQKWQIGQTGFQGRTSYGLEFAATCSLGRVGWRVQIIGAQEAFE